MLWRSEAILNATGGVLKGKTFSVDSVAIDSRKVEAAGLFVAIRGEKQDGHAFVKQAMERGATAALVSSIPADAPADGNYVVVKDTFEALQALAKAARARFRGKVIAVTGSVGKTGTKEAIRVAASYSGRAYATQGNLNNHYGLPLSLCNLPEHADFGVFELGMNHAGEIAHLTRLAQPDVAIITTVEAVHLEFFSSVSAIADAKAEIMEGLTRDGTIVLNRDNPYYEQLFATARRLAVPHIISFGEHEEASCRLLGYRVEEGGSRVEAIVGGIPVTYHLGTIGRHWALSSLAVLAALTSAGADLANSAAALERFYEPEGRGRLQLVRLAQGTVKVIDDCYNASPVSVKAALQKLAEIHMAQGNGRAIAVLGDMLELGDSAPELHRSLRESIEKAGVARVLLAGPVMKHLYEALPEAIRGAWAASAAELTASVLGCLKDGDVVLIKGSRGSRMDIVRDALYHNALATPKDTVNAV